MATIDDYLDGRATAADLVKGKTLLEIRELQRNLEGARKSRQLADQAVTDGQQGLVAPEGKLLWETSPQKAAVETETGARFALEPERKSTVGQARTIRGESLLARSDDPFLAGTLQQRALRGLYNLRPEILENVGRQLGRMGTSIASDIGSEALQAEAVRRSAGLQAQEDALSQLQAIASGRDSVVGQQAALAREQARRDIAAQLASQRGEFNPATQRAAFRALGEAEADIGARAAMARSQERQEALGRFLDARRAVEEQQLRDLLGRAGVTREFLGAEAGIQAQADAQRAALAQFISDQISRGDTATINRIIAAGG